MSTPTLLVGEEQRQVNLQLGPWIIGCCMDLVLQGALCTQFTSYYTLYPEDKLGLKTAVGGLALLTILKSVQTFTIIWNHAITFFGNLEGAILLNFTTWWESGNPLMVAIIGFYAQTYFCYRLYVISGSALVVTPIATIFVFALAAMAIATYFVTIQDTVNIPTWFTAHLSSVFVGDLLLSTTTAFILLRTRSRALPETEPIISNLIKLTFQTAAPAALCAMLNLVFAVRFTADKALFSLVFNIPLPKLYAISMMFTINARRRIRLSTGRSRQYSSSDGGGRNATSRRPRVQTDVELGQILVLTPTQTERQGEIRGRGDLDSKGRDDKSSPGFT
ncbi:hypothetical protein K438DRAFT_1960871 [Mycena galopus ATCC 62051]|nr:hypothetical protein K438DRAFT_1960871 [Mycena galopus ATCC 62051]